MAPDVNYLGVLVAAVVGMVVGFGWYGVFFRGTWMKLMGLSTEGMKNMSMSANKAYVIQFVGLLVMAYVLWHSLVFANSYFGTSGVSTGAMGGFWNWLGFVAPVSLGVVLWEGKSWKLWFINVSHYLAALVLMGVVLSFWM